MTQPRIACFSFTSCEGCQLQILNLEDDLLEVLQNLEIVNFREAMDEKATEYDVAFVEGSITRESEVAELKQIRATASCLVALGACATLGGVNALKSFHDLDTTRRIVYGAMAEHFDTAPTRRIADVVPVDYEMHGCPIDRAEFLRVTASLLMGIAPSVPYAAVCAECKRRDTACLFDRGQVCLGPITRGGCEAVCPAYGETCDACRGLVEEPNLDGMRDLMLNHGLDMATVRRRLSLFNGLTVREHAALFED